MTYTTFWHSTLAHGGAVVAEAAVGTAARRGAGPMIALLRLVKNRWATAVCHLHGDGRFVRVQVSIARRLIVDDPTEAQLLTSGAHRLDELRSCLHVVLEGAREPRAFGSAQLAHELYAHLFSEPRAPAAQPPLACTLRWYQLKTLQFLLDRVHPAPREHFAGHREMLPQDEFLRSSGKEPPRDVRGAEPGALSRAGGHGGTGRERSKSRGLPRSPGAGR